MSSDQVKAAVTIQRHIRGILTRAAHKQFVHNLKARKHTTNEILSSERGYVKCLDIIINVFYKPLKQSKVVEPSVIKSIFANIVEIHAIHFNLLKEMAYTPHLLGTVFLKNILAFRAYRSYIANYTTSLTTFNALLQRRQFSDIIKACCNNNKNGLQPSDLPALLNKPVVQLARYKLLLDDLLLKTNPQNEDVDNLKEAVVLLKQVVEGELPLSPRPLSAFSPSSSSSSSSSSEESVQSLQSTSSSASLARKLNAIAQTPHNLPYKLSPFVSRSVSSTPNSTYNPGDPSLPSYLRPTHTSYARANEGRAKKDQVTYTINNTPTWMPNGNPHSEKIYNTVYNAIPYTPTQTQGLDRTPSATTTTTSTTSGGKKWMPSPATPRTFDGMSRSSSSLSVRDDLESPRTPKRSPGGKALLSTSLTPSSSRKLLFDQSNPSPSSSSYSTSSFSSFPTTPVKNHPSTPRSHPATPSKSSTPSTTKTPSKIPSSSSSHSTPTKPASSSSTKIATTPSKSVVAAARAAGSNIPSPASSVTKPSAKSGTPKTPNQNGPASKIPVLKSPRTPAPQKGNDDITNGNLTRAEGEQRGGEEAEDETMTF